MVRITRKQERELIQLAVGCNNMCVNGRRAMSDGMDPKRWEESAAKGAEIVRRLETQGRLDEAVVDARMFAKVIREIKRELGCTYPNRTDGAELREQLIRSAIDSVEDRIAVYGEPDNG